MIDQRKAAELLELPHLTSNERTYLEDLLQDRLGKWTARQAEHFQGQMAFILEREIEPLICPNCQAAIPEIAARTADNAGDDDHRCPNCQRALRYCIGLLDGEQWWAIQPLTREREQARG